MTSRTVSSEAIKALDEMTATLKEKSPFQKAQIEGLRKVLTSPLAKEVDGYALFFADQGHAPRSLPREMSANRGNQLRDDVLAELWVIGTQGTAGTARGNLRLVGLLGKWERSDETAQADAANALQGKLMKLRELYADDIKRVRHHNTLMQNNASMRSVLAL